MIRIILEIFFFCLKSSNKRNTTILDRLYFLGGLSINWTRNEWQRTPKGRKYGYSIRRSHGKYIKFFFVYFFFFSSLSCLHYCARCLSSFFFSRETFFSAFQWKANARLYACRSVCLNSSRIGIAATTIKAGAIRLGIYMCVGEKCCGVWATGKYTIKWDGVVSVVAWFSVCPMPIYFVLLSFVSCLYHKTDI